MNEAIDGAAAPLPAGVLEHRRTHPITPFVSGWKIIAGVLAVLAAQNVAQLIEDFTVRRAFLAVGALGAVLVVAVAVSALSWWRTTYAITPEGVVLHHGVLTRTRRIAPQDKIESVSLERPALARLLGLAKVHIEIAGGSDSHLDIQYVTSADAERIRTLILRVAQHAAPSEGTDAAEAVPVDAEAAVATEARAGTAGGGRRVPERVRSFVQDGVTDGVLIARIPTSRLLRSLLRDVGFVLGLVAGFAWAVVACVLALQDEGIGVGFLAAVIPVILAIPRFVLSRIEAGWGFVSRFTDRGLRMRRGLFTTRADNLAPGRIQDLTLSQPLLWRRPGWVGATATVAGIEKKSENGPTSALPVGTREELARTVGHLVPALGDAAGDGAEGDGTEGDSATDLATIEHLLHTPARRIDGVRPGSGLYWIGVRTRVAVLLPGALAIRSGILTRRLVLVPRERIQGIGIAQGPLQRALGCADLRVGVAGATRTMGGIPVGSALALRDVLTPDAAHGRRYRERSRWPQPPLALAAPSRMTEAR